MKFWLYTATPIFVIQVGTLDSLVGLSDQLTKLDPFVESLVRHIAQYISDILDPEDTPKLHENLLVGSGSNKGIRNSMIYIKTCLSSYLFRKATSLFGLT